MKLSLLLVTMISAAMGLVALSGHRVDGCAIVMPRGKVGAPPIDMKMDTESALIVWDAANRTQHFIRKASFHTSAEHFGFLVPTPTRPELAEAPDAVFTKLAQITAPPPPKRLPTFGRAGAGIHPLAAAPTVTVLETKQVAGYDAAILEANDATALNEWLAGHEYQSGPELVHWLIPYIDRSWIITAFKIAKAQPQTAQVGSTAVRMSFQTDQPFFPYREPAAHKPAASDDESKAAASTAAPNSPHLVAEDVMARQSPEAQEIIRKLLARIAEQDVRIAQLQKHAPVIATKPVRSLKVYFLAESQFQGTLGESGQWPGRVIYAKHVSDADRDVLVKLLGINAFQPPQDWWLTEFLDGSLVRPGNDDVLFSVHANQ